MTRRKKSSGAAESVGLVAMFPWWAGLSLALFSYLVLHQFAQPPSVNGLQTGHLGGFVAGSLVSALATVGQFLVPVICIVGALVSYFARRRRKTLVANVAQSQSTQALDGMSWREFEMLVGEAFRLDGYRVVEVGGAGPDGGVDLMLIRGAEKFLVQCKQWRAYKVGVTVVRELYGVMAARGAAGGFVVTSGRFTPDATAFASGRNITLIDGPLLHGLIKRVTAEKSANESIVERQTEALKPTLLSQVTQPTQQRMPQSVGTPTCPSCGAAMAKRTAKRGANAGSEFWGCSTYPVCKGTLSI